MTKYFFGLGNPGPEYAAARHNVGFMVVDALAASIGSAQPQNSPKLFAETYKFANCLLVKPQTYMNESGRSVRATLEYFKENVAKRPLILRNVFVIHDDLDIEVGNYKIQFGTGPKIHNGLNSVYEYLKTEQFWHVRMGVDGRKGDRSITPSAYVLSEFANGEKKLIGQVISDVVRELMKVVGEK